MDETRQAGGIPLGLQPFFLYGTAWKEEASQALTELAIRQGFRGIDTANQRKHYHEAGVGEGVSACIEHGLVTRDELFLQSKFTFRDGQDHRLPYDAAAPIATQVQQSFTRSLSHLKTDYLDSYVLHGPSQRAGLGQLDFAAWRSMDEIHDSGKVRYLGISNVSLEQLEALSQQARVRPQFVQNRCYAIRGWDRPVREFCAAHGIVYQGFSLLTANREALARGEIVAIAKRHGRSVNQVVFRFALQIGMLPLTGTTSKDHMLEDLAVFQFELDSEEVDQIERIGLSESGSGRWSILG